MLLTKFKTAAIMLLAVGLTTASAGFIASWASAEDKPSKPIAPAASQASQAPTDLAWIDQRVQDWQPTKEERRMDEIGWAKDLRQALRLAKETERPVFLFTYS